MNNYQTRENEYLVDRMRAQINRLEQEMLDMQQHKTDVLMAEIVLSVVCFVVGFIFGAVYA